MTLHFYHWGTQCPIIQETLDHLRRFSNQIEIHTIEIAHQPETAKEMSIYFPFLTVFNGSQRWFRPLDNQTLEAFSNGEILIEKPHVKTWSRKIFKGEFQILSTQNIDLVGAGCTMTDCSGACNAKGDFLKSKGLTDFGIVHLEEERVVGGAEYMPTLLVPYDIPKHEKWAFLTCLYHSSEHFDYKSGPLAQLETHLLVNHHYEVLYAITDELGSFPNGDLDWFLERGYTDLGIISQERGYCQLHLVSKVL